MKGIIESKISAILIVVIMLSATWIWFLKEKEVSYSEPHEALLATEKDLLLLPAC